ncbi:glycosyl hydrolase family 18 protein [Cohnella sp. GCM10027633]|uniref:glycosyl hydrolase family 18 protein n=1 Tax=unclassified Cohnella TaxID=2636738 RepID=UPI0036342608
MHTAAARAILVLLSVIVSLCALPLPAGHAEKPIQVVYQGQPIEFAVSPFNRNNAVYIQARPFAETLGFRIDWLDKTRLSLTKADLKLVLEVGSTKAIANGQPTTISPAPTKVGATLFLPLRAIAESMQHTVSWNAATNSASIAERGTSPTTPSTPSTSPYKVVAYYPFWGAALQEPISTQPLSKLTHLNYAFANISGGQVVLGDADTDVASFKQLKQAKSANPRLRTLISVGGWTWSGQFSDIAYTASARKKFAASAVAFIRQYGFDGVDLDWEYPVAGGLPENKMRKEDKTNFTLLLQELRDQLDAAEKSDGREYLLTIAAGAFPAYLKNVEIAKIVSLVDWMNLMTYDFHGDWDDKSGHLSALYADSAGPGGKLATDNDDAIVNLYLKAGVPASKLVLGVPFYGRSWTSCDATNNGLYQACDGPTRKMYSYEDLKQQGWINANGFVRYWNADAKAPYLYKKTTGTFVTYEDAESIGYKASYVKSKKLGGAMIWELTQDDSSRTLLNALTNGLRDY